MSRQKWNDIFKLLGVIPPDQVDQLMDVDIQKEFNLIADKKSRLPAKKREMVVKRMNYISARIRGLAREAEVPVDELEDFIAEKMQTALDEHKKKMGEII